ncbi:hypothetical protein ACH51_23085 (plasmid) [Ralstonia solanacearum]|nr:hypothetical protein ACH51_23085 [Ralstonia solanacearum]
MSDDPSARYTAKELPDGLSVAVTAQAIRSWQNRDLSHEQTPVIDARQHHNPMPHGVTSIGHAIAQLKWSVRLAQDPAALARDGGAGTHGSLDDPACRSAERLETATQRMQEMSTHQMLTSSDAKMTQL